MRWITRERIKVGRIGCAWLIERFIDPEAEFYFVPGSQLWAEAERIGATPFHVDGADLTRQGDVSSFEVVLERYGLAEDNRALRAGLTAMGLALFGDPNHRMANVTGVVIPKAIADGEAVRRELLQDFGIEIGTSFGPLAGKIWRIGTMGYVCRKANVLRCLTALEAVLRRNKFTLAAGAAVDAAYRVYEDAKA